MRLEESQPVPTRNISLTPEQDAFVEKVVQAGEYQNASEAVRDALRGLQQRRREDALKLKALRAQLQAGIDALEKRRVRTVRRTGAEELYDAPRRGAISASPLTR
jgi:antitoxin ParD1/3/4